MAEYIEREALLKYICETVLFTVRKNAKLPTAEMRGANKVIYRIKSMRTSDVQEVKHGEWVHIEEDEYQCSVCREIFGVYIDNHPIIDCGMYYCANCGARMDKE